MMKVWPPGHGEDRFVLLGPPGAGKTTALLTSGLTFSASDPSATAAPDKVQATRNFAWWSTGGAVLIDTPGRYITQDVDPAADRKAWADFVRRLGRDRPRRPLNGVLVVISVQDLLELTADQLAAQAGALRGRIEELRKGLRTRLPVYVLVTKCDLLPGFVDWFGSLARKERNDAWGVTLDHNRTESGIAPAAFVAGYDPFVERLADSVIERLSAERDIQRRARLFSLPSQLRALRTPLHALIRDVFGSSSHAAEHDAAFLRGVYFTSATQAGTPIDRMLAAYGRELGLEQRKILQPSQGAGTSYFIAGVLNDVVFAETRRRGTAGSERRAPLSSLIAAALITAAIAAWWLISYTRTATELTRVSNEVARLGASGTGGTQETSLDPRALLPQLDAASDLASSQARAAARTARLDPASAARHQIALATAGAYQRMLQGAFQNRILRAVETTLRSATDANEQYDGLKAYRMLNAPEHLDAATFEQFMTAFWSSALMPPLQPAEQEALVGHLDALLKMGVRRSGVTLEPALVGGVRERLQSQSPAQRIASRLDAQLARSAFKDFTVSSLGAPASAVFAGADGKSEPVHVPGRYTLDAWHEAVRTRVPAIARQVTAEASWVVGTAPASDETIVAEALAAYRASYVHGWTRLVDDIRIKPATDAQERTLQAQMLGDANGPLAQLIKEVVRQTPVRLPDGTEGPLAGAAEAANRLTAISNLQARAINSLAAAPARMDKGGASPAALARAAPPASAGAGGPTVTPPSGAGRATVAAPSGASAASASGPLPKGSLSQQIAARLSVPCLQLVAGNFPFDRGALRDASFAAFSSLFAPSGAFDATFNELLGPNVSTASTPWRWVGPGAAPSARELERFRAAARVRDVLFARGAARPKLQLTFRPLDLDAQIDRFQLEIDGQFVRYAHGPPLPTVVSWPGAQGKARAQATPSGGADSTEFTGPWALFRLFDRAAVQDAGTPGHFRVIFDLGGRRASFDVETDVSANPFRLRELERFDCPLSGT